MTRASARRILIVSSTLAGIASVLGLLPALFAPMMFDAPGSEQAPATVLLFWSVVSFPAVAALSIPLSWAFYAVGRTAIGLAVAASPLVNVLAAAAAVIWIQAVRGGQLGG